MDANCDSWTSFIHDQTGSITPPDIPGDEELIASNPPMYLLKKIIVTKILRPD